ncbi:MAG TPA: four helix bundle protein [Phycisphaerae bacterium]|nr:four helix bundle protein [Phycisphaerae bacterium]
MTPEEMKRRTKEFGLRVIRLVAAMPTGRASEVIARQLLKAATSVGANYRAACRSRSDGDFLARMGIVEEEADEALYWMEVLVEAGLAKPQRLTALRKEGEEILAMVVASIKTVKARRSGRRRQSEIRNPKSEMV